MKEAVVFVLDANPSMNQPLLRHGGAAASEGTIRCSTETSRLQVAKAALQSMLAELMVGSVSNRACVIVCKTASTRHHKIARHADLEEEEEEENYAELPFKNLTELTDGLVQPTADLLRRVAAVETVVAPSLDLQGDVMDGIVLAADALYEQGPKLKFRRKIVVFTDCEHDIVMDVSQTLAVIDALRNMVRFIVSSSISKKEFPCMSAPHPIILVVRIVFFLLILSHARC
jgi:hypothetical protein